MKRTLSFRARSECQRTGQLIDILCIFFGRSVVDMTVIDDEVQEAIKTKAPVPDVIALISFGEHADAISKVWLENKDRVTALMQRGQSGGLGYLKNVGIWSFKDGEFSRLHLECVADKSGGDLNFEHVLSSGMMWLVEERRAFQMAPSGHLFQHPSGRKSKYFLLASELIRDEIDSYFVGLCVCFKAWGNLRHVGQFYIDTMGIYPVARAIEDIVRSSGGVIDLNWTISNFHSHDGLGSLHEVVTADKAVLISASTSGSMALKLLNNGIPSSQIITLLDLTSEGRVGLVVHAHDRTDLRGGFVNAASQRETVIQLTGEYFIATGKKPRALTLSKDHAPLELREFLNHFNDAASTCLYKQRIGCVGDAIDLISVNGERISELNAFKTWVAEEIACKTPVSVSHVMYLPGPGAENLANYCADCIGALYKTRPAVVAHNELKNVKAADVGGVLTCSTLVGDGYSLRSASRDLREMVPKASRHFLVGVALPGTEELWGRLRQFLVQSGEQKRPYSLSSWLVLATGMDSSGDDAWKRAASLMQKLDRIEVKATHSWSVDLISSSLALAGDALERASANFLPNSAGQSLKLTQGFVFWDPEEKILNSANHASVGYVAMASALQVAREFKSSEKCLRSSLHETVVLNPENFLRFNDGVLQASILRATFSHELDYSGAPDLSQIMREFLEKVFHNREQGYGEASLEFALALATGHLRLAAIDADKLYKQLGGSLNTPSDLLGLLYCAWVLVHDKTV